MRAVLDPLVSTPMMTTIYSASKPYVIVIMRMMKMMRTMKMMRMTKMIRITKMTKIIRTTKMRKPNPIAKSATN